MLQQETGFLLHKLGPSFGRRLGNEIWWECMEKHVSTNRWLLFSLHIVHYRPRLTEAELSILEALVQQVPAGVQEVLVDNEWWANFQFAVSSSAGGVNGPRTPLCWVAEEQRTYHTFYGSRQIDGSAL